MGNFNYADSESLVSNDDDNGAKKRRSKTHCGMKILIQKSREGLLVAASKGFHTN
jgi:hypothetical protein